jgi:hypothetical protein
MAIRATKFIVPGKGLFLPCIKKIFWSILPPAINRRAILAAHYTIAPLIGPSPFQPAKLFDQANRALKTLNPRWHEKPFGCRLVPEIELDSALRDEKRQNCAAEYGLRRWHGSACQAFDLSDLSTRYLD